MDELILQIDFDIKHNLYCFNTNIKKSRIKEIISEYLRLQFGKGIDNSSPNQHDLYEIDISLNLRDDSFRCNHNCGNKGLREGILMNLLNKL